MAHAVFSLKKMSRGSLGAAYRHDAREMEVKNADGSKTILNEELMGCGSKSYTALVDERLKDLEHFRDRKIRSDAVHAFSIVLAVPKEAADKIDLDKWKNKNIEWLEKTFNREKNIYGNNVLSVRLHMDESSPHLHAIVIPIDEKGHLNAYEYVHGPGSLRQLQTSYAEAMAEFGLTRGLEYSVAKHEELKSFYASLNEAAMTRAPEISKGESIEQYKIRADKAMSDMAKKYFAETKKLERQRDVAITKEKQNTIKAKMDLKEEKHAHRKLKEKIEDMEFEIDEPVEDIAKKIESINAIQKAIETIEDPAQKEYARDFLNDLIRRGREEEKEKKRKEEQKKKNKDKKEEK